MSGPPPLRKVIVFPLVVATFLAVTIIVFAPQLGIFAWGSAWIGTFAVLMVWNFLNHARK